MPIIELWTSKTVPSKIPDFVHPHITKDGNIYIIEVYPKNKLLKGVVARGYNIEAVLKKLGFNNPEFMMSTDESPSIDKNGNWLNCENHYQDESLSISIEELFKNIAPQKL